MKVWVFKPEKKTDKLLLAESFLVGFMVLSVYITVLLELIPALAHWVFVALA